MGKAFPTGAIVCEVSGDDISPFPFEIVFS